MTEERFDGTTLSLARCRMIGPARRQALRLALLSLYAMQL
jgi:hypothetical protein